ncbi:deoxynucleoside triphosphate triphosphohydrolase SAMHD1-like [Ctenopharyngodon idella]|uniref:deoxynucleoside triphosphate triphosphohydrolase SAMHD1-like n=1 Tax=Ctenopharyngodon idella TaxID=7959 RepID=UPI00222FE4E2|nr:deoxynucleoside triphosphate triphosphohydrolase SAMHD1-like [Ctenopharyngodon idella]
MLHSEKNKKTLSDHRKSLQDLKKSYEECEEPEKQQLWEIINDELQDILKKYSLFFSKKQMKIFNDPIHGHIELHPLLVKITDTLQFQRLRHIKQLGGTYLVYPGASHNRFEHSLGVAYLAGCLVKILHDNQPELKITKQDFLCVQIAGLCHDLGHGPFSHVFDGLVIPKAKKIKQIRGLPDDIPEKWKHEQMSVLMFDDIVKSLKAENEDVLKEHGLNDRDVIFIKELIEGAKDSAAEWTYKGRDEDKSFLYEIVANKQNGIDVDKWDYFARDCHHLGIRNSFDHQRLLKFARVCKMKGRNHICFRDKEADNVYDMFRTRYTLHRQAYQHKICNIIEDMFAEALLLADRDLHEGKSEDMLKISEAIKTAEEYSKLTDEIFEQISSSTAKNLQKSRDILDKIVRRKLPKFVGEARLTEKNMSKEKLTETWKAAVQKYKLDKPTVSLNAEDLPVYVVDLDHGMKDKNPIESVYFYSKRKPNEASTIKDYQLSSFLPKKFNEELVRVYYRRTDDQRAEDKEEEKKKVEEAEKCFQIWCSDNFGLPKQQKQKQQGRGPHMSQKPSSKM